MKLHGRIIQHKWVTHHARITLHGRKTHKGKITHHEWITQHGGKTHHGRITGEGMVLLLMMNNTARKDYTP